MIAKTWNVRDQTEKDLTELLEKKYKEMQSNKKDYSWKAKTTKHS